MLLFGPYRAIPDDNFKVFNLSSQNQAIERLPGLLMIPNFGTSVPQDPIGYEYQFDLWYYDYVLNDPIACSSLMLILNTLYDGQKVYICISDYSFDNGISMVNESFMKLIQTRYDIKYSIINEPDDYFYIDHDGCDFMSVQGIMTFDEDRKRFLQVCEENKILSGENTYGC
jgi:hypothetical protein